MNEASEAETLTKLTYSINGGRGLCSHISYTEDRVENTEMKSQVDSRADICIH